LAHRGRGALDLNFQANSHAAQRGRKQKKQKKAPRLARRFFSRIYAAP
jgi:hypothetical protein